MIVLGLALIAAAGLGAAVGLLWALRDHRPDSYTRARHPSTGGANRLNPPKQPCHVRIVRGELEPFDR